MKNYLNEKINELNKKFNGFEGVKSQLNENKLKTESSLRLLGELDERMNNYSQNISKNEEKTQSNEQKINKLSEDIDKLQILINSNILTKKYKKLPDKLPSLFAISSPRTTQQQFFSKLFDMIKIYDRIKMF